MLILAIAIQQTGLLVTKESVSSLLLVSERDLTLTNLAVLQKFNYFQLSAMSTAGTQTVGPYAEGVFAPRT